MKLLLLQNMIYVPTIGGANKANRIVLEHFVATGRHSCQAVAPACGSHGPQGLAELETALGVRGFEHRRTARGLRFAARGVEVHVAVAAAELRSLAAERIRVFDPDWVLVSSEDPGHELLALALEMQPERVVLIVHTPLMLPFGPHAFLPSAAGTELVRRAAGIVCPGHYVADYVRRHGEVEVEVLGLPVYGEPPYRRFQNFDRGFITLINPCAYKGLPIFAELARRLPERMFAAVPTWGTTAEDHTLLARLPNVSMLDPVDDIDLLLERTRVLLMPSLWMEAKPLLPVDTLLRGVPVLASNVGGLEEAMLGAEHVLPVRAIERYERRFDDRQYPVAEVPEQDVGPWQAALERLLDDRAHYERVAEDGRARALAYVQEIGIEHFEAYFERLAERAPQCTATAAVPPPTAEPPPAAQKLAALSREKRALLALRALRGRSQSPRAPEREIPALPRTGAGQSFPLSFGQQRLWFLQQLEPASAFYNGVAMIKLAKAIDIGLVMRVLSEIIRRHEVLRTVLPSLDGQPAQSIQPTSMVGLPVVDLAALTRSCRDAEAARLSAQIGSLPFRLEHEVPLRLALLRLMPAEHVLLFILHHVAGDGWSNAVLTREFSVLYEAFGAGRPSPLPELPIQYADYAVWQRRWLEGTALGVEVGYWRRQLAGAPALLELPTDRSRPPVMRYRGSARFSRFPKALTEVLETLSLRHGLTLFMALLAGFQALLWRWSGQPDICVGTPIAGRNRAETEGLIGFFVNTLVLRIRFLDDPNAVALLGRVRETTLEAHAHQDLPFEKLVEELQPERSLSYSPLFQVMLVLQNTPRSELAGAAAAMRATGVATETASFDLLLAMATEGDQLVASMGYASDLFDAVTIERLLGYFRRLLEGIAAEPGHRLATLELMSAAERHQLLQEHNDTDRAAEPLRTVLALLAAQMSKSPEAIAVVDDEGHLSYFELEARSSRLARYLSRLGVGLDDRIGLGVQRSVAMTIGVLGILKTGAAYVPLDPSYPEERLAFMLAESRGPVIVTESALAARFPAGDAEVVRLDTIAEALARESTLPLPDRAVPQGLAYVIYTSGSTGKPKGVALSHAVLANLVEWHLEKLLVGVRTLQYASLSFDASFHEMFAAWCSGGSVWIVTEEMRRDLPALARLLTVERIEKAIFPVVVLQRLAEQWHSFGGAAWLREVTTTGEQAQLTPAVVELFRRRSAMTLHNHYGPSETHVVTAWRLDGEPGSWPPQPPIGRPIARTSIHLLDPRFERVPAGVVGRLYIGGVSLARGYLERPALTAERFIPDPWGDEPGGMGAGGRLYDTGDLARWLRDGSLQYLGRCDHQVKIRGFRVELGEIERALGVHPEVAVAVVVAREDVPGDRRLVAYVVAASARMPPSQELRDFVASKLPAYMVPAAIVWLEKLPLGPTGKINRAALPAPEAETAKGLAAPRTATEEILRGIWAEVLRREAVGIEEDFFALGGHSLLAIQVISRVRRAFDVELPVRVLFATPTIVGLAAAVEHRSRAERGLVPPPLERVERVADLPLSFAQQRLWFIDQLDPGRSTYNISSALCFARSLDPAVLAAAFSELARRHEPLRTSFPTVSGKPVQQIAVPSPVPLPVVDLESLTEADRGREARRLSVAEANRPFDLANGPMLRVGLLRLGAADWVLGLTMHHIASDGWSMGILTSEVSALYAALAAGRPSPLPELPIQYADFAVWQRRWFVGGALAAEVDYWRRRLAGPPPVLELPADRPRPNTPTLRGASLPVALPSELGLRVRQLARAHDATLFMALLAVFCTLLTRLSSQKDLVLGTDVAGRSRPELEGLVGFFINQLVLRVDTAGDPSFAELLARTVETTRDAFDHQEIPFDQLVELVRPARELHRNPLFQVVFALQNVPTATTIEKERLAVSPLELKPSATDFDLVLILAEDGAGGLLGLMQYSSDLFDATRMRRLLRQLEILLGGVVERPAARLGELPLLSPAERAQIGWEWNPPENPVSGELFPALFAARAQQASEAIAAVCAGSALSYGTLRAHVRAGARRLAALGAAPETVVALLSERGLALLTGVLAIFERGAAYLPLDPAHPPERLAQVLGGSGSRLVLVARAKMPVLAPALALLSAADRPVVAELETLAQIAEPLDEARPLHSDQLAYVIYTSGSTGVPKGAMLTHGGMANHLRAKIAALGLDTSVSVAQNASQCFDVSVWQMLAPLAVGGRVHVILEEVAIDPARLLDEVALTRLEVLEVVPSLLRFALDGLERGEIRRPRALRWLVPTGEALAPELCRRWLALFPSVPLINAYGPTECSDDVTHHVLTKPLPVGGVRTPIGRVLPGLRLYVLDAGARPLPVGVVGELVVGGVGVGRGYLRAARRTAEIFIPDPFASAAGARLYRTGDLAVFLAEGTLDFLGRRDHQVKLRGVRIELGEIEAVLAEQPGVREHAVTLRPNAAGELQLVAWVAVSEGESEERGQVEAWRQVFDQAYAERRLSEHDAGIHLRVWIDSYTGRSLPEEEIVECFEDSVKRLGAFGARKVLEIGCGSGLLLRRLAPMTERYVGTDISEPVLGELRSMLGADLPQVELVATAADDLGTLGQDFDLVVLNEVVQYFPSVHYLLEVLAGAVERLAGGGWILVGGVRHRGLLEAFHTSVELHRAPAELARETLQTRIGDSLAREKELALDPELFFALKEHLPRLHEVRLQLKGGRAHNELTRFRYDVALRVAAHDERVSGDGTHPVGRWLDWQRDGLSLARLEQLLVTEAPAELGILGVPDARLAAVVGALAGLAEPRFQTAGELRAALLELVGDPGVWVEPAQLWALAERQPYDVVLERSAVAIDGRLSAILRRRNGPLEAVFPPLAPRSIERRPLRGWANAPTRATRSALAGSLRQALAERLPSAMVPQIVVELESLPRLPSGKIDRTALAAMELPQTPVGRLESARSATPFEELLAPIWAEVLGIAEVDVDRSFFDLGGHSLLATQVMTRMQRVFHVELPLRALFDAPTIRALARRIEAALREQGTTIVPALAPAARDQRLPLSFAQQRLWFIDQLSPGSPVYNVGWALRVRQDLDVAVLAATFTEIVRRHEALRTSFPAIDGEPIQEIAPPSPVTLPVVDLRGLRSARREEEAHRLATAETRHPFDLANGPVMRVGLLQLGARDHVLTFTMHHITSDAWSMAILVREVVVLYEACIAGRPSPLPELEVQYADYAIWQRRWLAGEVLTTELDFWRRQLAGAPSVLELPTDRPRPVRQSYRGATRSMVLPADLSGSIAALGRREGATTFMALLAAFQILLHRWSGQPDVSIGVPISGRGRAEIEPLIGFFVNTLVLRTDLGATPTFSHVLEHVRETALAAYAHQDLPFEQLVMELQPERNLGHSPLFQVMLAFQNAAREKTELHGQRLESLALAMGIAKFDLTLLLGEDEGLLRGVWEHDTDLFDATTIERLSRAFERLLGAIAADPRRLCSSFDLLAASERQQLLREHNDTEGPADGWPRTVLEAFATRVPTCPEAVAVACGEQQLSYLELERRSNRLARYLCRRGAKLDDRVGLGVERSLEMTIAVLGVLKTGAAYVPLDPSYPADRLAFMLAETRGPLLVTETELAGRFPAGDAEVVCLDAEAGAVAGESAAPLGVRVVPEALGYVIYTSGSTGRPKGVALSHLALANLVDWHLRELLGGASTLQYASLSFDASFHEMFAAWCSGGRLHVVSEELRRDAAGLARLLAAERVEKAILPVVMLQRLAEATEAGSRQLSLCEVTTTGEQLHITPAVADFFQQRLDVSFHNHYGPSETHVVTAWTARGEPHAWPSHPPIGRPIARTAIRLLDRGFELVALGAIGRLYVAGVSLARGYLERPALTAERFVPDPWGGEPGGTGAGGRLYDTGDLARWLRDGSVQFLGRGDHQVKIRGHRVELDEIESALGAQPGVGAVAVLAREDRPGDRRLAAYVVSEAGASLTASQLRAGLGQVLPDYMVPAAVVLLDALPLTPNQKIDRAALGRMALPSPEVAGGAVFAAPRSAVEELLCEIWAEVLGCERVGLQDDFFALGGHSLLATQVVARVRRVFGVGLAVRALFETPTVAGLAATLERGLQTGRAAGPPPLERIARGSSIPLSFAQQRLWFIDQLEPGNPAYNIPLAWSLTHEIDAAVLATTFGALVERHESLRTCCPAVEGEAVQQIALPAPVALPVVDLERLDPGRRQIEIRRQTMAEARLPFDLLQGPVLRVTLMRSGAADWILLLTMHHIASDGWSMGILAHEVSVLYEAFAAGRPSPLVELPIQYADYAVWQRRWLSGEVLEAEIDYWRRQLAGAPPVLDLPLDRPRPAVVSHRGATRELTLPGDLARSLKILARREGTTLFMTLLAGFQAVLSRWTGQRDICVGTPIAGRNQLETEGLIGFFVNTLVLRTRFEDDPDVVSLLARVRETALEAHAHQELPFEKLVEELQPERSLNHSPLFQAMFVLQNVPRRESAISAVQMRAIEAPIQATKFDFMLTMAEGPDLLHGSITYATELFDLTTIARFAHQLERALEGLAASAQMRVSSLSLLSQIERHQLAVEHNDTRSTAPLESSIPEQFEQQVVRCPERVAAVFGEEVLSYAELDRRANQLAWYLRGLRVGAGARVVLLMKRSLEMLVSLLGILKTGAAYVPLDVAEPGERLGYMLEQVGASVLLSTSEQTARFAGRSSARLVLLDREREAIDRQSRCALGVAVMGAELAYVMFTSGSTGRPKGVAVPHRAVVRLVCGGGWASLGPDETFLLLAPIAFDASTLELWGPLLNRGRLVVMSPQMPAFEQLAGVVAEQRVSTLWLTAGLFHQMAAEHVEGFRPLRQLLAGGDVLSAFWVERVLEACPSLVLINGYGPTENTTFTCCHRVRRETVSRSVPIGRPIADTEVYLVDRHGHEAALGVVGELWTGGAGLARGYLRQPGLTAERFVPDVFGGGFGSRLYRTGDLARRCADGTIEFLGRADTQIKLRGFRIELREIETRLDEHPKIQRAVVAARSGVDTGSRLVAYVVPVPGETPSLGELRRFLREHLPELMLPSALVALDTLPLGTTGKVDRRLLPEPRTERPDLESPFMPPQTGVERAIAEIWQRLLKVENVGLHDNFFDLGGHSLLLSKLRHELQQRWNTEISLLELFEHPTVSTLAQRLRPRGEVEEPIAASAPQIEVLEQGKARIRQRLGLRLSSDLGLSAAEELEN